MAFRAPRRDSRISDAFDAIIDKGESTEATRHGVSTATDRAEIEALFDQLAASHVNQVRNVMLELEIEDVVCSWIEQSKPALISLGKMAAQMELDDLCQALDRFCEAIDHAIASGKSRVAGDQKQELQRRYRRLIELIPQAFALDGERDRREPVIVESLLRQVSGVEKITIDKLFAVGLNRLSALNRANAGDIAAAAGIDAGVAKAIAAQFRSYREGVSSAVAALDATAERRELSRLLDELRRHHASYEIAAAGWSEECRERKRKARRQREEVFLRVRVALARLGETELLGELEKRPFGLRIVEMESYLEREDDGRLHS